MQLIKILLIAVSFLAALSGIAAFFGSKKDSRLHMFMFLLTAFGVFAWVLSIMIFLTVSPDAYEKARIAVFGIYISGLALNIFAAAYAGWGYKAGYIITGIITLITIVMSAILIHDPGVLYSDIVLSSEGNSVVLRSDFWYYSAYSLILGLENVAIVLLLLYRIRHASSPAVKKGWLVFLVGLIIGGIGAGIFDVMLPPTRYDLIWIGPLLLSADLIAHYYAVLRYHVIALSNSWLKKLSYIVLASLATIIYFALFFVVFSALFKVSNPTSEVILLNFIMVVLGVLMTPTIIEINSFFQSLSSLREINLTYIVGKLDRLVGTDANLSEVCSFLSDHLHTQYIGIIVGNKLFESSASGITAEDIELLTKLESPSRSLWITKDKKFFERLSLTDIAELRTPEGEVIGKILFGKPLARADLKKLDLARIDTVVTLVALIVSSRKRRKH
ncbi:hypothetical protein IKF63_02145 [Candidatus Saccharibacteria bacterium]|nr:hypothetical protein [Candidatus Saccharibacteria bacterium]